jgi:chromosome segregation ATPase
LVALTAKERHRLLSTFAFAPMSNSSDASILDKPDDVPLKDVQREFKDLKFERDHPGLFNILSRIASKLSDIDGRMVGFESKLSSIDHRMHQFEEHLAKSEDELQKSLSSIDEKLAKKVEPRTSQHDSEAHELSLPAQPIKAQMPST